MAAAETYNDLLLQQNRTKVKNTNAHLCKKETKASTVQAQAEVAFQLCDLLNQARAGERYAQSASRVASGGDEVRAWLDAHSLAHPIQTRRDRRRLRPFFEGG